MLSHIGSSAIFKPVKEEASLNENYSANEDMPNFAIVDKDGNQICSWMRCKDYINDTVWSHKTGNPTNIFGWSYDPKQQPLSDRWLMLAMRWKKHTLSPLVRNLKNTVEKLEKRLGVPKFRRTRFSRVSGHKFMIFGSPVWMRSSIMVSFFTWLLRAALTSKDGDLKTLKPPVGKDVYYYRKGQKFIEKLMKEGFAGFKDAKSWEDIESCDEAHETGFIHYCHVNLGAGYGFPKDDIDEEDWDF